MGRGPQANQDRNDRGSDFHRNILENLSDGVITIGLDGRIQDFNPAASDMFGLGRRDVLGKTLAEAFITIEGFDEFTSTILDSMMDPAKSSRKVVNVQAADGPRLLTLTISRLSALDQEGEVKTTGMIAVCSDITEVKELRETEIRMAQEIQEQNADLQKAYRKIEKNRDELNWALKRVQVARITTTTLVLALFLGIGIWNWVASGPEGWRDAVASEQRIEGKDAEGLKTVTVEPREFKSKVSLMGTLEPWRQVKVTSPSDSRLKKIYFKPGQYVAQGERLIDLDTEELLLKFQESQVAYENAYKTVKEFEDWENSPDMIRELRAFSKAKMSLDRAESELRTSEFLLKQGLISALQHEDQKRNYDSQLLDFETIKQNLATTRARAQGHQRKAAALEFEKARKELHMLEESLRTDSVLAPVSGAVLPSEQSEEELVEGKAVEKGAVLLTIADSERIVAATSVSETEVTKIQVGQQVTVQGDAFPNLIIQGTVDHVSSQARKDVRTGTAQFDVIIELESLDSAKKARLRGGMSCQIRIIVYHNPAALMVPIEAIDMRGGFPRLHVLDPAAGIARGRKVEIGLTSLDSVEVLSGLSSGERVMLPEG